MRLFIGVPVSEEIKEKVKPIYEKIKETGADLNLVPLENLHFTIKFLGETDQVEEIKGKLSTIKQKSFTISLENVGVFPSLERMNVIWIGTNSKEIISLMKETDNLLNYIKKNDFPKASITCRVLGCREVWLSNTPFLWGGAFPGWNPGRNWIFKRGAHSNCLKKNAIFDPIPTMVSPNRSTPPVMQVRGKLVGAR